LQKCDSDFEFCMLSAAKIVIGSNRRVNNSNVLILAVSEYGMLHKLITMPDVMVGIYRHPLN